MEKKMEHSIETVDIQGISRMIQPHLRTVVMTYTYQLIVMTILGFWIIPTHWRQSGGGGR